MSKSLSLGSVLVTLAVGAAAGAAFLYTGGCSKEPSSVQVADGALSDRVAELERQLRDSQNESQKASRSADAANLSGASIGDQMTQLNARINKLETELAEAKAALGAKPAAPADGTTVVPAAATEPSTPVGSLLTPVAGPSSFSDTQIDTFRKLSDEVERRKNLEAQAKRVRAEIERAKVTLTPAQEDAVIRLQASYQDRMREIFSRDGLGTTDADREERRSKMDALKTQFETDLRSIVPSSDADKLVDSMRRGFPGLFPRRESAPGMRVGRQN